jgi:excisionase family DNA binding protein
VEGRLEEMVTEPAKPRNKILALEELPDIMSPKHVADFLGISRGRVYEICQVNIDAGGLQSFTIGKSRKITKDDLIQWIELKKMRGDMTCSGT